MKKYVFALLLFFSLSGRLFAQEMDTITYKYWYYPSQNVYYNETTGDYWYYDAPTVKWMEVKQLPSTYVVADADTRYVLRYKGRKVWMDNDKHRVKYKVKKDGTLKQKNHKSDDR